MVYKQKLRILSCLTAALALVYGLTLVFDPDRSGRRSDAYTWLDPRLRDSVDRIDLKGDPGPGPEQGFSAEALTLWRRNGRWLVAGDGVEYPARQGKIDDLLDDLSRRDVYPTRSASPSSHERFGLSEAAAGRITLRGGAGLPLLDLLVGKTSTGAEVYLRKAGGSEVRSGKDRFRSYTGSQKKSWYDLRLFPENGDGGIPVDLVQRVTLVPPAAGNPGGAGAENPSPPPVVISREQNNWRISAGELSLGPADIEKSRVDSYISGILSTTGDDFTSPALPREDGSLSLELGDGRVIVLRLGPPDGDSGQRRGLVLGMAGNRPSGADNPYGYLLASWAVDRIFREPEYFRARAEIR
jgi:hypothetical protein